MTLMTLTHLRLPTYKYFVAKPYIILYSRNSSSRLRLHIEQIRETLERQLEVYPTYYDFNPRKLNLTHISFSRTPDRKVTIYGDSGEVTLYEWDLKEILKRWDNSKQDVVTTV